MESQNESKVIPLFGKGAAETTDDATLAENATNFEEAMRRNEETKERMRRERLNANKRVLRSYRIKN